MNWTIILWVYIGLLVLGGLMGYIKAKSVVSLVMSAGFAVLLGFCAAAAFPKPLLWATIFQALLAIVFLTRLAKTKKFMPAGMLLVVTVLAMLAENLLA